MQFLFAQDAIMRKALILSVLHQSKEINGRKKFQKMVYLANSLGWNAFKDYRLHLFGPYSDGLYQEIVNLKEEGMIKEDISNGYSYTLTDVGDEIYGILDKKIPKDLKNKTSEMVDTIRDLSANKLELLSTLHHINKSLPKLSKRELINELLEIKPKFEKTYVKQVLDDEVCQKLLNL